MLNVAAVREAHIVAVGGVVRMTVLGKSIDFGITKYDLHEAVEVMKERKTTGLVGISVQWCKLFVTRCSTVFVYQSVYLWTFKYTITLGHQLRKLYKLNDDSKVNGEEWRFK